MNVIEKRYPKARVASWCAALAFALTTAAWADAPTNQTATPLTPQAKAVVENLRRIADAGQFVYSWTHPWQETDPAFRAADGDGWRAKDPDEFTFSSRFNDLTGEEPVMYFADLRFVVGTYLGDLDVEPIERNLLRELDGITWVSVNLMGCTADVEVRQKAQKPEIQSMEPCNVVAKADGVITKLKVREGFAAVKEGSGVAAGELIVSGFNPTKQGGVRYMHADADIYADVISNRELKIPKSYSYYSLTENKIDRTRLKFLWFEMPLSLSFGSFDHRAVTVRDRSLVLNGTVLPVGTSVETTRELEMCRAATNEASASEIFRNAELLYEAFSKPDSRPVSRKFVVNEDENGYSCEFNCVFNENIAQTAEFSVTED